MSESSEGQDNSPGVFSLSLDFEEDIEQEIEAFVRFKRLRDYDKAHEIFQRALSRHVGFFPVAAEYADLLLEEGRYKVLSEFLDIQIEYMETIFEDEELELFRVMRSLVRIHTRGALRPALVQARRTWNFLHNRRKSISNSQKHFPSDVQIHIFEIYIAIIVFAFRTSNWVRREDVKCPWDFSNTLQDNNHWGFVQWYEILSRNGDLWSASRVLHILLKCFPIFPPVEAGVLFKGYCYGGISSEQYFALMSEMKQLIAFNACLDRAEALAEITAMTLSKLQPPEVHDEPKSSSNQDQWRIHEVAFQYLELASTCQLIISPNQGNNTNRRRLETMQMKLDILYGLLSGRPLNSKAKDTLRESDNDIVSRDPEYFFTNIVLSSYHSNSQLSFDCDELIRFQMHKQGDLIGLIRTWALLSSRLDYPNLSTMSTLFRMSDGMIAYRQKQDDEQDDHIHYLLHHLLQLLPPVSQLDKRFTKPIHLDQILESGSEEFDVPICLYTLFHSQGLDLIHQNLYSMEIIGMRLPDTSSFDLDLCNKHLRNLTTGNSLSGPENTRLSVRALLGIPPTTGEPRARLRTSMKRRLVNTKRRGNTQKSSNESSSNISSPQSHDVSIPSEQTGITSLSGVAGSDNTLPSRKKREGTPPPQSFPMTSDEEYPYADIIKEVALNKIVGPIKAIMKTPEITQRFYESIKKRVGGNDKLAKPPILNIPDNSSQRSFSDIDEFLDHYTRMPPPTGSMESIPHG